MSQLKKKKSGFGQPETFKGLPEVLFYSRGAKSCTEQDNIQFLSCQFSIGPCNDAHPPSPVLPPTYKLYSPTWRDNVIRRKMLAKT